MGDVADCAAIELNIENITGVSDADDDFIRSAQKFVVSSSPSYLLSWAITETVPATHGGNNSSQQITLPVKSDSLLFVRRDQFEAQRVDGSMRGFIGNSNSLNLATNTFPKYYIADGNRVIIKPDPDDTYTGHAQYVDYSKINDDCDLRNAVVYHAAASEFTKLASGKVTDWSDLVSPIAPSTPNFGSDLTISSTSPVPPASPSFTYTAITSVSDMTQPLISVTDMSSASGPPSYTSPVLSLTTFPTLDWTMPTPPVAPTTSVQEVDNFTGQNPTYTSPIVSLTTAPTISDLSITAVPPAVPSFTSVSFTDVTGSFETVQPIVTVTNIAAASTYTGAAPTFTPPVMGALDFTKFETHLDTNEDTELAQGKIQQFQAQIGEFSAKLPEAQAKYETENVAYQSAIQESVQEMQAANQVSITNAQTELDNAKSNKDREVQRQLQNSINNMQAIVQENQRKLALYQAEQGQYTADVSKSVQEYQQTLQKELQIWQGERTAELQKFGSDMTDALNTFNQENAIYQGTIQGFIQESTLKDSEEARKLQIFASNIQSFQNDVSKVVQGNQGEFTAWQQENNMGVQKYASDIQIALNKFNEENAEYQQDIQKKVQNLQKDLQVAVQSTQNEFNTKKANLDKDTQIALQNAIKDFEQDVTEYGSKLQKYTAEVGTYQQDMNKEIQDFVNTLQKESQEYQSKLALYTADVQKYQGEVGEKTQKSASATQNAAYYSAEAKKYYEWSLNEINMYIQNNSKMINKTMAAKQQQAAQQRR